MIAIYSRLSIEDEDSNSIENQQREGLQYAKLNGLKKEQIFYYNEGDGIKGSDPLEKRPALSSMMKDIKNGKIKIVWTRKQSRIARKLKLFNNILEEMIEHKVKLYMGDRGLLDLESPMVKMMLQIMSAFDEYAPNQQSKETKKSLLDNFNEGKVWGIYPYGYRTDDNMIPYIDTYEATIINRIFIDYLSGKSAHKISQELNIEKVPTKYSQLKGDLKTKNKYTKEVKTKSKKAIQWSEKTIKDLLSNTWYNGIRTFHGTVSGELTKTGEVPRIVDEILFNKVQNTIQSRKGKRTSTPKYNYLLKGLIRCNNCGCNYYGRTRKSKNDNFYMCSSKRKSSTNCGNKSINITALESFVVKHLFNDKNLMKMMESISNNNETLTSIQSEIKLLNKKLKTANDKVDTFRFNLGKPELKDDEDLVNLYLNAKVEVNKIKNILLKLNTEEADLSQSVALNNYKTQLLSVTNKSDFKTLQTAVNRIIENITIKSLVDTKGDDNYAIWIQYKGLNETSEFYTQQPYKEWIHGITFYDDNDHLNTPFKSIVLNKKDIVVFN